MNERSIDRMHDRSNARPIDRRSDARESVPHEDERTTTSRAMATKRVIKPLLDRVLVEKSVQATKSLGGVLLPESMTANKVRRTRMKRMRMTMTIDDDER